MMEAAGDHGLRCGLSIPVHCPDRPSGLLVVVSAEDARLRAAVHGAHERLWAAACDTWAFMAEQVAPDPAAVAGRRAGSALTTREKECLLWTAEGKTAGEVGAILHLSAFTVNRHVFNAARKLGCTNKYHAACRALISGQIAPTPVVLSGPGTG